MLYFCLVEITNSYQTFWENLDFKQDFMNQLVKDLKLPATLLFTDLPLHVDDYYLLVLPYLKVNALNKIVWKNMINRVDLSEKQVKNLIQMDGDYIDNMSKAMVIRVLQKITIKWTLK